MELMRRPLLVVSVLIIDSLQNYRLSVLPAWFLLSSLSLSNFFHLPNFEERSIEERRLLERVSAVRLVVGVKIRRVSRSVGWLVRLIHSPFSYNDGRCTFITS